MANYRNLYVKHKLVEREAFTGLFPEQGAAIYIRSQQDTNMARCQDGREYSERAETS